MNGSALTDEECFPLLDDAGRRLLRRLREHPRAPRYNWHNGERLTAPGAAAVRAFERSLQDASAMLDAPPWVERFIADCVRNVPFYRARRSTAASLECQPILRRHQIRAEPWSFVPDTQPLDSLITYSTSGTTGDRLDYLATPELPARYLPLMKFALAAVGVTLAGGNDRVSIVHICAQRGTVVLNSISSLLGGAGFVKVNLDPADWRDADDIVPFLDDCGPELFVGDPFALARLAELPLATRPSAILSSAAALSDAARAQLATRFGCPVIDVYSMNESGPIAYSPDIADEHILFDGSHTFVEVIDADGRRCRPGVIGEIVLTGGLNNCLPLIRYGTGDYAAIELNARGQAVLKHLHARPPVRFVAEDGRPFNSVDVATALSGSSLSIIGIEQRADGSVCLTHGGPADAVQEGLKKLGALFGSSRQIVSIHDESKVRGTKRMQFRSEMQV